MVVDPEGTVLVHGNHWRKEARLLVLRRRLAERDVAIALVKTEGLDEAAHARFNQQVNEHFEGIRDYIVTHYKTNTRGEVYETYLTHRIAETRRDALAARRQRPVGAEHRDGKPAQHRDRDADQLQQVVTNLIVNALQAMDGGGKDGAIEHAELPPETEMLSLEAFLRGAALPAFEFDEAAEEESEEELAMAVEESTPPAAAVAAAAAAARAAG